MVPPGPPPPAAAAAVPQPPPPPAPGSGTTATAHQRQHEEDEDVEAPATKRQKVGDVELEPEEDFLAAHPGGGSVKVQLPAVDGDDALNGQVVELTVESLDITLADLKKLIKDAAGGLAANKQKISSPALGFLTDKRTLAYYNIALGATLQLSLKERGGRKK